MLFKNVIKYKAATCYDITCYDITCYDVTGIDITPQQVAESAAVSTGDKRTPSVGSTPHSSNNSAPRSSSSVSSSSGQDKYFYRDKLVFDPDVYINNPSYSGNKISVCLLDIILKVCTVSSLFKFCFLFLFYLRR